MTSFDTLVGVPAHVLFLWTSDKMQQYLQKRDSYLDDVERSRNAAAYFQGSSEAIMAAPYRYSPSSYSYLQPAQLSPSATYFTRFY